MSWDHERVEELLAGYALGGLDPEDAALAERALIEHVPGCVSCRQTLEDFRLVAGDLALAAPPAAPPETLHKRLARVVAAPRRPARRWAGLAAAGAMAALFAGAVGWNFSLAGRLDEAETRQRWMADAVTTITRPDAGVLSLTGTTAGRITAFWVPGEGQMYLVASRMPDPEEGVYRVWLVSGEETWSAGTFVPRRGVAWVRVDRGIEGYQRVIVTHELTTDSPTPSASPVAQATVESA